MLYLLSAAPTSYGKYFDASHIFTWELKQREPKLLILRTLCICKGSRNLCGNHGWLRRMSSALFAKPLLRSQDRSGDSSCTAPDEGSFFRTGGGRKAVNKRSVSPLTAA